MGLYPYIADTSYTFPRCPYGGARPKGRVPEHQEYKVWHAMGAPRIMQMHDVYYIKHFSMLDVQKLTLAEKT
jgi:hypothetical protein